jgi:aspartyl-tRNA(Asn)/glutamyl-tRNA(Gln) amidotransferase subunit C
MDAARQATPPEGAKISLPAQGFAAAAAAVGARPGLWYSHRQPSLELTMAVDADTVRRVAHLARVAVAADEVESLRGELNAMLAFIEQLAEVDVAGVEPMTSVVPMAMKMRADTVTDGGIAGDVTANAPALEDHFFLVPKVVE